MVARTYTSPEQYRYGFNGQERETELDESTTSAEYWMYDGRLGRRWNRDPKPFSSLSPYSCFINSPILINDPEGDIPPWLAGFAIGVAADYAGQVAANMAKSALEGGDVLTLDNFTNVDIADILISGIEGAVTVGASASTTFSKAVLKKGIKRAVKQVMVETTTKKVMKKTFKVVAFEVTKAMVDVHKKDNDIEIQVTYDPVEVTTAVVLDEVSGKVEELLPVTKLKVIPDAANPNEAIKALKENGEILTTQLRLKKEEEAIKNMVRTQEAQKLMQEAPAKVGTGGATGWFKLEVFKNLKMNITIKDVFKSDYKKGITRRNRQSHNRARASNHNIRR